MTKTLTSEQLSQIDDAMIAAQVEFGLTTGYGSKFVQNEGAKAGRWEPNSYEVSKGERVMEEREYVLTHPNVRAVVAALRSKVRAVPVYRDR